MESPVVIRIDGIRTKKRALFENEGNERNEACSVAGIRQGLPDERSSGLRHIKTVGTIGQEHEQLHVVV